MSIQKKIEEAALEIVSTLYGKGPQTKDIVVTPTNKDFNGDWTLVVFPFTRFSKKSPENTAEEIGEQLRSKVKEVEDYNVIKGFLNLTINSSYWISFLGEALQTKDYGFDSEGGERIMVEYSAPNTNKPQHLGHIRNNLLGYSVSQILSANGHKVIKANLINDRGIHICKSMLAWQKWGDGKSPSDTGVKGDHYVGDFYVKFNEEYTRQVNEMAAKGMDEEEAKKEAPLLKEAQEMLVKWENHDP
ncbi:MAG: arginine--tRNA ligase, partial [Bacteroidetes bacterium]|nr:arginine--tRNA ligase [Bacteroidota bacterium]